MPKLGLGNKSSSASSMITPGIVTDSLVMRHNYNGNTVQKLSDGAVYFASGDTIVCSDSDDFTFTAGNAFSVGCWFNSPSIGTDHLIGKTNNTSASHANNEWYFHLASGGKLCLQCFDASESAIIGRKYNTALSSNTWYHGFATYDGGTADSSIKIYLNGVRVDDSNQNAGSGFVSMDNTATDLTFARTANGSVNYTGYMCNAGIWSRELTQSEIKSIMFKQYADLTTTEKTSLVSWWNLDNNLTTQGSSSWVADEANTTFGSNITPTWTSSNGAVIDGQTITLGSSGIVSAAATISPVGVYKVNVTVTGYTGDGVNDTIEMPWDGGGSSNMQITANGSYEFYEKSSDTGWLIYAADGRGATITINSITKANGNIGELL